MPSLKARIETERPSRFLTQFCKHASSMGSAGHRMRHGRRNHADHGDEGAPRASAEWSENHGVVTLPWGTCTMSADGTTLTVTIEAADDDALRRIQKIVTSDFNRFSRRDPLTIDWDSA